MKVKTIDMQKLMEGLGIKQGDIVCVGNYISGTRYLLCNDKFDLTTIDGNYDSRIPNLIVGMVSGKHSYKIFSLKHEVMTEEDKQRAKQNNKNLKEYKNCKPVVGL